MRSPLTSFLATASSTDIGGVSQKAKFAILFESLAPFEAGQRDLPSLRSVHVVSRQAGLSAEKEIVALAGFMGALFTA
tara:strand:+ start:186 stop:419 length:234 start_codon:yes stop_codon:yes gene_type:complete